MKPDAGQAPAVIGALAVALFPHALRLPAWIVIWCAGLWGYGVLAARYGWRRPGKGVRTGLTLLGILGAMISFGHTFGGDAFAGLLAVMAGLKPMEMATHRDRMVTAFLAYFIVITSLFVYENLAMTLYMGLSVLVTTSVLIRLNHPEGSLSRHFRLSGIIMAQALPLTIILFFLFPRVQGSLWGLPQDSTARSGFSDTLSPGRVSQMVQSEEIAFRAQFQGDVPERRQLYWRGIVFYDFDGRSWRWKLRAPVPMDPLEGENPATYTIGLEPHQDRWLFALDLPATDPDIARLFPDYTLMRRGRVRRKLHYRLTSLMTYNTGPVHKRDRQAALELPEEDNPRSRALARQWAEDAEDPREIVDAALRTIREEPFVYTLSPPTLGANPIDAFFFDTRRGYCEHYASAFAFLMRAADVPARVVGGYQGGTQNPYGSYITVRQSDAHAWVEVYLEGEGWVRIDPTAAVAPDRIERGVAAALAPGEAPDFLSGGRFGGDFRLWRAIRDGWDAVNIAWDMGFAGYAFEQQQSLLKRIGIDLRSWKGPVRALLLAFGLIALIAVGFGIRIFRKPRAAADPVREIYESFCRKLARVGLVRDPHLGPVAYARRIGDRRPDLKTPAREIVDHYVRLRYGGAGVGEAELEAFRRRVRRFQPDRRSEPRDQ